MDGFAYGMLALITVLVMSVMHLVAKIWAPKMGVIPRYVLGVLGFGLPLSGSYWRFEMWDALWSFWLVVSASGVAVGLWHFVGSYLEFRNRAEDAEEREAFYEGQIDEPSTE